MSKTSSYDHWNSLYLQNILDRCYRFFDINLILNWGTVKIISTQIQIRLLWFCLSRPSYYRGCKTYVFFLLYTGTASPKFYSIIGKGDGGKNPLLQRNPLEFLHLSSWLNLYIIFNFFFYINPIHYYFFRLFRNVLSSFRYQQPHL